jgi:aspartyl protease family protein
MLRILIFAALAAGIALALPPIVEGSFGAGSQKASLNTATSAPKKARASYTGNRRVVLTADPRGHFQGTFRINGRKIEGMIDTGASVIAINRSSARKLGLSVSSSDFKYRVNTANGTIKAARVLLKRVELQSIRVQDVDAFVLDDKSLTGTLIGMSFLNKLNSYQARNGEMVLVAR